MISASTKNALRKMYELTRKKCEECPTLFKDQPSVKTVSKTVETRCCDKFFCKLSAVTCRELGGGEPEPTGFSSTLPFMGPEGCVIPPEFRPVCTGFVCEQHLKNPGFRSRYEKLQEKLNDDLNLCRAVDRARAEVGGLEKALQEFRDEHPLILEKND